MKPMNITILKSFAVNGTTGEGKSLTKEERKEVVEHWIKVSKKRYGFDS